MLNELLGGQFSDARVPRWLALLPAIVALIAGVTVLVRWVREELKIRALGGHAPVLRTYLPLGTGAYLYSFSALPVY
jgi:hypothetical protein